MALIELGMVIGAIVEMGVEGTFEWAKRQEAVVRALKKVGMETDTPPTDFKGTYIYALVDFGVGKPPEVLELFRQETIQSAFRQAYETGNIGLVETKVQDLVDWHALGESFHDMDIDPRRFVGEFSQSFQAVVDRSRTMPEVRLERKSDHLAESVSRGFESVSSKLDQLLARPVALPDKEETERHIQERVLDAEIDRANELVERGKAATAKRILTDLADQMDSAQMSVHLRFRLETALGNSCLSLQENEQAAHHLENALELEPQNPKALANAALASLVQDRHEEALRQAQHVLSIEPDQETALIVLIHASAKLERLDATSEDLIKHAEQHRATRRALAMVYAGSGQHGRAESLYRQNLESDEHDPQDLALLAQLLAGSVQEKLDQLQSLRWRIPDEDRQRLQEAEKLATQAAMAWTLEENRTRHHEVLLLRASVRGMLHEDELALSDCRTVLQENPNHPQALSNGGLAALRKGALDEAAGLFERALAAPDPQDDVKLLLATAYLESQRYTDVLRLLADEPVPEQSIFYQAERLTLIAHASLKMGDHPRVEEITDQLLALGEDTPVILDAVASVERAQGLIEEARSHLQKALAIATGGLKDRVALSLASLHYSQGEYASAIPIFEIALDPTINVPPVRDYVVSLLNSGDWSKAYKIAREIRNGGPAIPGISVVEARVSEYLGELGSALDLYAQLAELEPKDPEHLLRAAAIRIRMDNPQAAVAGLKTAPIRFWDNPLALIGIAQILAQAKRPMDKILPLAYRARRLGRNDPDIHLAYVNLFLRAEPEAEEFNPQAVAVGTAVRLSGGEKGWYTILDDEPTDIGRGELLHTDRLAQKLLGLRTGDTAVIREGISDEPPAVIAEVQSKYVRAFQESIDSFGLFFPGHLGIQRVTLQDHDPSKFFIITEKQFQLAKMVRDAYLEKGMPLGAFARLVGRSLIEVFRGLTGGDGRLRAATGSTKEQETQRSLISRTDNITLELTALLTLAELEHLDLLSKRFQDIYVAQALLDELTQDIQRRQWLVRDHSLVTKEDEKYVFVKVTPEAVQQGITHLEMIRAFVTANCSVVPATAAVEMDSARVAALEQILGYEQLNAAVVARQTDTVLYSDDLVLRALAHEEFSVEGVWTQPVLGNAADRALIRSSDYHEAIVHLALADYHYVSLSAVTLVHLLESQDWHVSNDVAKVFQLLAGPDTSEGTAVDVLANFIGEIWPRRLLRERKLMILDLCLQVLVTNRLTMRILPRFRHALQRQQRLMLVPWYLSEIESQIGLWLQARWLVSPSNTFLN